jgi:hypothetical protein
MIEIFAPKEEQERRKEICKNCQHNKNYYCELCKCPLISIRKLQLKTCPANKW